MFSGIPTERFKLKPLSLGILLGIVSGGAGLMPAWATHGPGGTSGLASLTGSNFEIDIDANLKVDHVGLSTDWATFAHAGTNPPEKRKPDLASGSNDDSFGQGSKEDTAVPSVVTGSIPPNKSDLLNFGVYQEGTGAAGFLNLFWHRVQEPSGTTNMDFEFNQSPTLSGNGVTPVRTAGDILIQYDLAQGGTNPQLFVSRWVTTGNPADPVLGCEANNSVPCWQKRTNLSASALATGSINTSAIPAAEADGLGSISARTFGEAQIAMSVLFPSQTQCLTFGSAYLKSRSSDSFTAALKDFIAPIPTNLSNCGSLTINKTDDATPPNPLSGAEFTLYKDATPTGLPLGVEDTVAGTCTTGATGTCTISNVLAGNYCLDETIVPTGHNKASGLPTCGIAIAADQETVISPPFVNPRQRGAIQVTKTAKHAGPGSPNLAATFTVKQGATPIGTITTDGTTGIGCLGNLLLGAYTVEETTQPAGYAKDPDVESVTVTNGGTCVSNVPSGANNVSFVNTPLSDITVSFSSQVPGGTAARISCTGLTATPADQTPNAFDDTSETFEDLLPGTTATPTVYNCKVEIDP